MLWDHRSVAYVMPPEVSVDIDTELDWQLAEAILRGTPRPLSLCPGNGGRGPTGPRFPGP